MRTETSTSFTLARWSGPSGGYVTASARSCNQPETQPLIQRSNRSFPAGSFPAKRYELGISPPNP